MLLLILYSRPFSREERVWWLTIGVAAFLSLGRFLPFAAVLHPVLSAGGRIRYPVKLWYVVALALIPLVAGALKQWWDGRTPSRWRIVVAVVLPASAVLCTLVTSPVNLFSLGAVLVLVALGGRWRWRIVSGRATVVNELTVRNHGVISPLSVNKIKRDDISIYLCTSISVI